MDIKKILLADNLADDLKGEKLREIGAQVVRDYESDKQSRAEWERQYEEANKLALQVAENKSTPWENASNVKFPLITVAALQFNARAYPFIINNGEIVRPKVVGNDPSGQKAAMARRKAEHMNWQLMWQDEDWEEGVDRMTMVLPICGTAFKKTYYCQDRIKSEMLLPDALVVDYWSQQFEGARKTHRLHLTERKIKERVLEGVWKDVGDLPPVRVEDDVLEEGRKQRAGKSEPPDSRDPSRPRLVLEQCTFLDLDNDGYAEPYVVTVDWASRKVFRIVPNFSEVVRQNDKKIGQLYEEIQLLAQKAMDMQGQVQDEQSAMMAANAAMQIEEQMLDLQAQIAELERKNPVIRIEADEMYTSYQFLPNPDGSKIYGLGFGALLGPISHSVDTLINQLIDSGTLQNSNSGFIGRGAKIRGGDLKFKPFEWKVVQTAGADLKNAIVPLPVNSPSPVLFNLLGLLIEYAERVSSVKDMMVGETPGQNTPATTSMAALEQGLKVFTGIFRRIYRALRTELRHLHSLNYQYLDEREYFEILDGPREVLQQDYASDGKDIVPAADPNMVTSAEKMMKAQFLAERSAMVPGYNTARIERMLLEAMGVPDVDAVFPVDEEGNPLIQPPPDMEMEIKKGDLERKNFETQERARTNMMSTLADLEETEAKVLKIRAEAKQIMSETELAAFDRILESVKVMKEKVDGQNDGRGMAGRSSN